MMTRRTSWWITDDKVFPNLTEAIVHALRLGQMPWCDRIAVRPITDGSNN